MPIKELFIKFCLATVLISHTLADQSLLQAQIIKEKMIHFVQKNLDLPSNTEAKLTISPFGAGFKLSPCAAENIDIFLPPGRQMPKTHSLGVRCTSQQYWTIYHPIRLQILSHAVVAVRPLSKGHKITKNDLIVQKLDNSLLIHGHYGRKQVVVGQIVKRSMSAGVPISPKHITAPISVKKGQILSIMVRHGSIQVSAEGVALADGRVGDIIGVKNLKSSMVVNGQVISSKYVEIRL